MSNTAGMSLSANISTTAPPKGWAMTNKAPAAKKRQRTTSDKHKTALAEGREQGQMVRRYREALESGSPSRVRKGTPGSMTKGLHGVDEKFATVDALAGLERVPERVDLEREVTAARGEGGDLDELESGLPSGGRDLRRSEGHLVRSIAVGGPLTEQAAGGAHWARLAVLGRL
jgi:hypothetical protein